MGNATESAAKAVLCSTVVVAGAAVAGFTAPFSFPCYAIYATG